MDASSQGVVEGDGWIEGKGIEGGEFKSCTATISLEVNRPSQPAVVHCTVMYSYFHSATRSVNKSKAELTPQNHHYYVFIVKGTG